MAAIQVNGSNVVGNYYTGGSTKNSGGVAIKAGTASKTLTNRPVKSANVGVFGSVVVDGTDTDKALSGGVFAYNDNKPVAMRLTTSLATVANKVLLRGADVPSLVKGINKIESVVTNKTSTAFRAGNFNLYTGKYAPGSVTSPTDSFGTDNAASVTRAAPGKLVYNLPKKPVAVSYKPKTS